MGLTCAPDAPHSNPLDPYRKSGDETGLELRGRVMQKTDPFLPLPGAQVSLFPEQKFTQTDQSGDFSFNGLNGGAHTLILSRQAFVPDTQQVDLDTLQVQRLRFFLNGRPVIRSLRVYSEFIDQWWPDALTRVIFELIGDDPDGDGDLQAAGMELPALTLSASFLATGRPDSFYLEITDQQLSHDTLLQMIGRDMRIRLSDASGGEEVREPVHLIRILETSPVALSPAGLQTASPSPLLEWEAYQAGFEFSYQVSVYVVSAGIPVRIHQMTGLSPQTLTYQYPDSLPPGTYYWTVGVRDALGNLSRSKEASFLVQ